MEFSFKNERISSRTSQRTSSGSSIFLICEPLTRERLPWLCELFESIAGRGGCGIFLTGDALFSLVDSRTADCWRALVAIPGVLVTADGSELSLLGFYDRISSDYPSIVVTGCDEKEGFWYDLVLTLIKNDKETRRAAFLLCHSPYMNRIPVFALRFLAAARDAGLSPELYTYLDGVHVIHDGQMPSEFENIGQVLSAFTSRFTGPGEDPWFAGCSRCATARGYCRLNSGTGFSEPASCAISVPIVPLKDIIGRFPGMTAIISHTAGAMLPSTVGNEDTPPGLAVFITHSPYGTEWTYGGITLAFAASMQGLPATVIFIEEGVYALCGLHDVAGDQKLFNIQEMILSTMDVPGLSYRVHAPSLDDHGVVLSPIFSMIREVQCSDPRSIFPDNDGDACSRRVFVIIF